jgi:hypothetical protein
MDIEIKSAIKHTIDFGERLQNDAPQGMLNVSIGGFNTDIPVFIDNESAGKISQGKPLILMIRDGHHTVEVCAGDVCERSEIDVKFPNQTSVDFGERLKVAVPHSTLRVSIGGYNATIPVFIDTVYAGEVSSGKPLDLILSEGNHTVKVCVGSVCEQEDVEIKFATQSYVDFEQRLKRDVEFSVPTVRIVDFFVTGNTLTYKLEFINPDKTDHTLTATIGVTYSIIEYPSLQRKNNYARFRATNFIPAGRHYNQSYDLYLPGGTGVIASAPSITEMEVT